MSFFTSLMYTYPVGSPIVKAQQLAAFVARFRTLGVSEQTPVMTLELSSSLGELEEDTRESSGEASIARDANQAKWVVSKYLDSFDAICEEIDKFQAPIGRAYIALGNSLELLSLSDLAIPDDPEEIDGKFCPDGWSLQVGPVEARCLDNESTYRVGGMAVSFFGSGYLYPWTLPKLRLRLESDSRVAAVMSLCKEVWPVKSFIPDGHKKRLRKEMGDLWPYPESDGPNDWFWTMAETG